MYGPSPTPSDSSESDVHACWEVFNKWQAKYPERIGCVEGSCNVNEIKHVIGRCDFFIGSRMHACIGAISQSVPAVSIAYSDKFIGVMQSVGVDDLVADPRHFNEEEILKHIGAKFDERADIRHRLQEKMPRVKKAIIETLAEGIDAC